MSALLALLGNKSAISVMTRQIKEMEEREQKVEQVGKT